MAATITAFKRPIAVAMAREMNTATHMLTPAATISQAQTTELVITFRDIAPTIRIAAPEGTKVFLDDEELSLGQDLYKVLPGDHVVKFVVGDYEIIRNVKAENGHGYSVSLTMDATLSEE